MKRQVLPLGAFLFALIMHGTLAFTLLDAETRFVKYPQAASQYLQGVLPGERLADLSPAYFSLHVLSQRLGGGEAAVPVLVLQLLLTAATAALLALILRRHLPVGWSVVGVGLFLFSRGIIVYAGLFEPEPLLLFSLVAMVWLLGRDGDRWRLAAGGALALALLTRPSVLPLVLLVPLASALALRRRDWLRASACFVLLPLLALLLLSARNARAFGSFSPTVMNPGFVFFEGNNPLSNGQSSVYPPLVGELKNELSATPDNPHVTYRELARRASGRPLTVAEANRYWAGRALAFITDHPGAFFERLGHKLYSLPHAFRWHDLGPAQQVDDRLTTSRLPTLTLPPLFALALCGAWAARRRWRELLLPGLLIGLQVAVMLLLYVSERQRLVLLPFLILFAGLGLQWVTTLAFLRKTVLATLLVIWILAFSPPTGRMRDTLHLWEHYRRSDRYWVEALALREQGRLGEAVQAAAASLAAAPWLRDYSRPAFLPVAEAEFFARAYAIQGMQAEVTPSGRFDAALLALHAGHLDEAKRRFDELLAEGPTFSRVYLQSSHPGYYLALIALRRGDREGALRRAGAILDRTPGEPFTLALLHAVTGERRYRDELQRYYGELDAAWLTGLALFEAGRNEAATEELEKVARRLPELRRARCYLAASLGASGLSAQGRAVYAGFLASPDPVLLEHEILALYAGMPGADAQEQFRYGLALASFGRREQGVSVMQAALQRSNDPRLREEFRRLVRWLAPDGT